MLVLFVAATICRALDADRSRARRGEVGKMYWIGAGLFAIGALCGTFMRLAFFAIVLAVAFVVAIVSAPVQGIFAHLLSAVLAVVALQVGYAAGIMLRAAMRPLRSGSQNGAAIEHKRPVRVPPEQKHR